MRRSSLSLMVSKQTASGLGLRQALYRIVTVDDATSEIYPAFPVEEEGTMYTFHGLRETIALKGLFCSLYTDRGSHYFFTPKAGGKVDPNVKTQVGRPELTRACLLY